MAISKKMAINLARGTGLERGRKLSGAKHDTVEDAKQSLDNIPAARKQRSAMNGQPVKKSRR